MSRDLARWSARPRPEPVTLAGRYVRLEPHSDARHGRDLFEAGSTGDVDATWRYLKSTPLLTAEAFAAWSAQAELSRDPLHFAIVDAGSGHATGRVVLKRIDAMNGVVEVGGVLFGPKLARTRGATEALYLLTRYVFDALGYRRFEWQCDTGNGKSRQAAERFGFRFEGVFRQHHVVRGRNRDTAWFSLLDHEWPARRDALERWLDPANFDAAGRQRSALARTSDSLDESIADSVSESAPS